MNDINRRNFIKKTALAGAALTVGNKAVAATEKASEMPKTPLKSKLKIGLIGVGMRGRNHLNLFLRRSDCDVTAICDTDAIAIAKSNEMIAKAGKKTPKFYQNGERDYLNLLDKEDIDAVIISTPWRWHSEMSIASMNAGVFTGVEVCGGFSIDECWQLVNAHERSGTHLFFLENVCYRRDIMAVLNMVRADLFGEMVHLECGYQHDLRHVKFNNGKQPYGGGVEFGEKGFSEAKWRTTHSVYRNGDLYPTHGIGPVAQYTNINRGNRLTHLTSTASKTRGLHNYIVENGGENHPNSNVNFKLGDVVTTVLKTSNEESIIISHDTNLPRPYSLGFRVQGTKGLWMDVNKSIYVEGKSPSHRWESQDKYMQEYDHELWKRYEKDATGAGHGGMDFFLINSFVECAKRNIAPPFDVYDAATWLAITPLSEQSIASGSTPQAFPDFTRGRWMHRKSDFAFSNEF
ncbi:MAG: Gfo/Idh/MocA family oxidoreductase [Saprospiraceae bacterium]